MCDAVRRLETDAFYVHHQPVWVLLYHVERLILICLQDLCAHACPETEFGELDDEPFGLAVLEDPLMDHVPLLCGESTHLIERRTVICNLLKGIDAERFDDLLGRLLTDAREGVPGQVLDDTAHCGRLLLLECFRTELLAEARVFRHLPGKTVCLPFCNRMEVAGDDHFIIEVCIRFIYQYFEYSKARLFTEENDALHFTDDIRIIVDC